MTAHAHALGMRPEEAVDAVLDQLRSQGQRITGARRAVVETLAHIGGHPSAEELLHRVRQRYPTVHRATVYRTLDTLSELGVVTHVHLGDGASTYHLALGPAHPGHLHAKCRECGRIVDLPGDLLGPVADRLAREREFELDPAHVALSGRCGGCRDAAR
ncbi:Fur family transcriptional regulator [Saccharomonospora xinjiangensis]|uniref:Fur family transcriptional regulator n=1 Tax=Saccharomonospora xinjiangensis TaxID=75294 RepID=UPI00106FC308|nr:Fur family transcriptional regulator [Saccharomonospora xinjiangensis]QBQ60655.1 Ferric uptake regulation protein [Saccharomonospora xinjiangensis]